MEEILSWVIELQLLKKGKAFPQQVTETQRGVGMLGFHSYFDIRHKYDGKVVNCTCRPHFALKEIHLCYRLSRSQGYLMRTEGSGRLKPGNSHLVAQCPKQLHRSPPCRWLVGYIVRNNTINVRTHVTLRRVRITIVAVESNSSIQY